MSAPGYQNYRESGVEWLGLVPSHWTAKPLKRVFSVVTERTPRRSWALGLENIEGWSGRLLDTETEFEGEGVAFEASDILYGKLRPYLAKVYVAERPGEAVGDFHVLRAHQADVVSRYIAYQLLTREMVSQLNGSTFGARMPRVGWDFMGSVAFAFPPLAEQAAIAAFLDRETGKIDGLVEVQTRLIELLKEKRQAVISHAVTKGLDPAAPMKDSGVEWLGQVPAHWELKRFKDVCDEIVDCKNRTPDAYDDGEYFVVRTSCVRDGEFDPTGGYYTDGASFREWTRKGVPAAGDVLFTREAPAGEACLAPADLEFCLGQRMMFLRADPSVMDPEFLLHSIYGPLVRQVVQGSARGSTVSHLRVGEVGELRCFCPPLDEQYAIAKFLSDQLGRFEALASNANRAMQLLQEHRVALISAAVTGKIDVRGRAPEQAEAA